MLQENFCHSQTQVAFFKISLPLQSSTAEAEDVKKGEQFCPQVRYPTKTPELLSFHVGLPQTSFVLAFENIPNLYGVSIFFNNNVKGFFSFRKFKVEELVEQM